MDRVDPVDVVDRVDWAVRRLDSPRPQRKDVSVGMDGVR